ncbi:MAG TPA: antitermination protein NusG, partial [Spongiibacteraceae bacterium]|nr:antitermination protein NusG [Spongiibacteraceae bacterium]
WGAMFTFLTGVVLLELVRQAHGWDSYIIMGATLGTLMFLNVWLIIWPAQKIVCGITPGDGATAAPKAALASRTNTLFSGPMLIGMMGSFHGTGAASHGMNSLPMGLWIVLALILALQANAIFGKTGPMTTVVGVVHLSLALALGMIGLLQFV